MSLGPELVLNTVKGIVAGTLSPIAQNNGILMLLNSIKTIVSLIYRKLQTSWYNKSTKSFPGSYYGDFKFMRARVCSRMHTSEKPVLSVSEKRLYLDYPLGSVEIVEIKPNGKKNMDAKSFINGLKVAVLPLD